MTTRFASGGRLNAANGSAASSACSASTGRTIVRKRRPRCALMAASALRSSEAGEAARASNTTLPLDSTVFTAPKPAASKLRCRAGIFAFIGLTPRRNAA